MAAPDGVLQRRASGGGVGDDVIELGDFASRQLAPRASDAHARPDELSDLVQAEADVPEHEDHADLIDGHGPVAAMA